MALKLTMSDPSGMLIADAVHSIARVDDKRQEESAIITVYTYNSEADRDANKPPIPGVGVRSFEIRNGNYRNFLSIEALSTAGSNHIKNCYDYLKTLPIFENATDC